MPLDPKEQALLAEVARLVHGNHSGDYETSLTKQETKLLEEMSELVRNTKEQVRKSKLEPPKKFTQLLPVKAIQLLPGNHEVVLDWLDSSVYKTSPKLVGTSISWYEGDYVMWLRPEEWLIACDERGFFVVTDEEFTKGFISA